MARRTMAWVRFHVLFALALAAVMTALPLACSSSNTDGYAPGPVLDVPPTCTDGSYLPVTRSQCPESVCLEAQLYAVCVGDVFAGCACTPPPGGVLSSDGGGAEDSSEDDDCCFFFDGSDGPQDGPGDGPLFDVGNLGDCSGEVAMEIPASKCGSCTGSVAYALCSGLVYSTCSCDLPPGYVLVDGGLESKDAGAKDATMDGDQ